MRRLFQRLFSTGAHMPRRAEWVVIAILGICGLTLAFVAATVELQPYQQLALAVCTAVVFLVFNRRSGRPTTLFLTVLSALVSLRYIVWRVTETLEFNTVAQGILASGLVLAEAYAIIVLALGYIQTVFPLERKPAPLPANPEDWPTVDVYIPSYNEDLDIVRATVLAAMAIDWPRDKLRVYILDDGRRLAFRDFAASCGAGYIIRPDNAHAKAGNLNHAMTLTDGEFIAIFDCDHVPTRAFLQMTMGWLARDPRLAFIQTPHHFYSPDPFQRNLAAGTRVPAEGNMFYGLLQDSNDFWNAAFFCGSCAVIRREALNSIGGFATQTVTEDAHTALRMHRKGWQSAYLRLPLAAGLATERLILHIGQRVRWARGMLQILRTDCPLVGPGLSFGQRICYLNAMLHFMFAIPRVVFLTSPLAFLFFSQNIIAASPVAIIAYAMPHIFHSIATNARIQGNWRHSFWSEIYETVMALFLVRINIVTMLSPKRGRFNVTDKGGLLAKGLFRPRSGLSEHNTCGDIDDRLGARTVRAVPAAHNAAGISGVPAEFHLGHVQPVDRSGGPRGRPRDATDPQPGARQGTPARHHLARGRANPGRHQPQPVAWWRGVTGRTAGRTVAAGDGTCRVRPQRPTPDTAGPDRAMGTPLHAGELAGRDHRGGKPCRAGGVRPCRCLGRLGPLSGGSPVGQPVECACQHPRSVSPSRPTGRGIRSGPAAGHRARDRRKRHPGAPEPGAAAPRAVTRRGDADRRFAGCGRLVQSDERANRGNGASGAGCANAEHPAAASTDPAATRARSSPRRRHPHSDADPARHRRIRTNDDAGDKPDPGVAAGYQTGRGGDGCPPVPSAARCRPP